MIWDIKNKKNKGFTLVEILVAVSLLVLIILAVNRIYFAISKNQKSISGESFVQSDLEYFTRLVSNNVKLAQIGDGSLCSVAENKYFVFAGGGTDNIIFIKDGSCLQFYLDNSTGIGRIKFYNYALGVDQFITSSKTNILSLTFDVEDDISTGQPMLTVLTKASPVGEADKILYLQTSASVNY